MLLVERVFPLAVGKYFVEIDGRERQIIQSTVFLLR